MYKYFLTIPLLFSLMGCNLLSSNSQTPISIKTDKNHYDLNEDDSVKVTITNTSSETIYYSTCFSKIIEVIKNDKVIKNSGTPVCYCICTKELKPGKSIPVNISSLSKETFISRREDLMLDGSATYRIRYPLYYDKTFGYDPVSPENSRSNIFTITRD